MPKFRTALFGAIASLALLGGAGAAFAQDGRTHGATRTIEVPAGAVVIVLPAGGAVLPTAGLPMLPFVQGPSIAADGAEDQALAAPGQPMDVGFPFGGMPDALAMLRQMQQMMNHGAAMFNSPAFSPADLAGAHTVIVSSFSDGHGTCTRRVVYDGSGAPKVQVSATGDAACGRMAGAGAGAVAGAAGATRPAAAPQIQPPAPSPTRTWRVENTAPANGLQPRLIAQLGD